MYYRRPYQMSSRVDTLKWMGILQLVMGLLVFILAIVMASIELDEVSDLNNREDIEEPESVAPIPMGSMHVLWFAIPVIVMAVGAGTAGSIMSRYEGLTYNIPARHLLLVLSTMNGMISVCYIIFGGMITFELIDANIFDSEKSWVEGVGAIMIVMLVVIFFNMLAAFLCVVLTALWNPPTDSIERGPVAPATEKVIVEEKPYYSRHAYSDSPYYSGNGHYSGRSRTLPALKYY